MSRFERDVPGHHAAYRSPQRFPKGDVLRPSAVRMDDIGCAQPEFFGREAFGVCAFRQGACGRTNDGLIKPTRSQPLCELQQGFLPAAPGVARVNVNDG